MLTATVEPLSLCVDEMLALIPAHYEEISEHKLRGIPLEPQVETYLARDAAGQVIFIGLRDAGKLVGYHISFVTPGLHYQTCLTAIGDIYFVYPDERGKRGGILLFKEWERECKRRGVKLMSAGIKVRHAGQARRLLEIMGFMEAEIMFWKFLDEDKA